MKARRPEVVPAKPQSSLDVHGTIKNLGELVVRRAVEPACNGVKLWDNGLGDLVGAVVETCDVPAAITADDFARALGLVPNRRGRRR